MARLSDAALGLRARDRRHFGIPRTRALTFAVCLLAACTQAAQAPWPEVRYEPSPPEVVTAMLELGDVGPQDVVYDLGCGDGRIVIEAARRYGARAVCVDIDPERIAEARANAAAAGVLGRIAFRQEDLLATELAGASVVTLFLSPDMNLKLRPRLERELAPGARIVSHWHRMGGWRPERTLEVSDGSRSRQVFLWVKR
jgi:SAM-dependent methyltransferase